MLMITSSQAVQPDLESGTLDLPNDLLDLLRDPVDEQPLRLSVGTMTQANTQNDSLVPSNSDALGHVEGVSLFNERTGARYAIRGGVVRFAGEAYAASFGRQWNRYDVARPEEDAVVFQVKTGQDPTALSGWLCLDGGCGGGRYTRLLAERGARVIGLDLSTAVDKAAALTRDHRQRVLIAQADLLHPPVAREAFDLVFSLGVLHHTPDPRAGFAQLAARVKPGGLLAVWLYRRNTLPQEWLNSGLRAVTTRLPAQILEPFCIALGVLGSIPLINRVLNKVVNFSNHPDWTLRVCDNFDWYAPKYQSHHTPEELQSWFESEGFEAIEELPPQKGGGGGLYDWAHRHGLIIGSGVNVVGRKPLESHATATPSHSKTNPCTIF